MRISDAVLPARPLDVPFEGDTLHIEYRLGKASAADLERIREEQKDAERAKAEQEKADKEAGKKTKPSDRIIATEQLEKMLDSYVELLLSWDLTEDDGVTPVPITREGLWNVPLPVFSQIMREVQQDQRGKPKGTPTMADIGR